MGQRVGRISAVATTASSKGLVPASPATIWRWVAAGTFPKPFKLGPNTTVFDLDQVDAWLSMRKADLK
jgi:predicted DNA-binding transcriptional regulator AlpA